jgi:hypothetical protein
MKFVNCAHAIVSDKERAATGARTSVPDAIGQKEQGTTTSVDSHSAASDRHQQLIRRSGLIKQHAESTVWTSSVTTSQKEEETL